MPPPAGHSQLSGLLGGLGGLGADDLVQLDDDLRAGLKEVSSVWTGRGRDGAEQGAVGRGKQYIGDEAECVRASACQHIPPSS